MTVVFLCVANSARSQMAEGLARHLHPNAQVHSAGSAPSGSVHPMAIEVMREVGIDISEHRSKSLSEVPRPIQQIVTLCAEEHCPVLGEEQAHIHAPIPDPARFTDDLRREQALERFRDARDAIQRLIERLASEIFFHKV